ncbi:MAG: tetratricopeptide repeat protein [Blastocatellia bacterium]|nr:tetratricopeptide repeat protein [Blastocatellia bacterium]
MTNLFYASALATLLCASAGLPNTSTINMETNVTRQASSEEEAVKEATELIRQSHFSSEGLPAAEKGLWRLLEEHRDSRIAYILSTLLESVQERQALRELNIAMFYQYKRSAYQAAEGRLKGILSKYPKYSRLDDVLYQLALLQIQTGRGAEAKETLQKLLNQPGFYLRAMDAREKLESLGSGK